MNSLMEDIKIFYKYSRLAPETLRKYSYRLDYFSIYLSEIMNIDKKNIYLNKVYLVKDSLGIAIRYLPIDSTLLDDYFKHLIPKGFYTLRDHYSALNSFFRFLGRNSDFQNPMESLEFNLSEYYPEKKYSKILTRSGIIKFLNSLITHSKDLETDLLIFTILLSTGCRISEVLNLQLEDIDGENNNFKLKKTKNKSQRIVNLRPGFGNIINQYATNRNRGLDDFVFLNRHNKKYSRKEINELLKKYLYLANLPSQNIHSLRHTFATLMADEDTPILIIQQLLGHKSIKSTKGYINPNYIRNQNFSVPENRIVLEGLKEIISQKNLFLNCDD